MEWHLGVRTTLRVPLTAVFCIGWCPTRAQVSVQVSPRSEVSANDGNNGALSLPESDWAIQLDQWAASFDGGSFANSTAQLAIIEPWVPNIIFPQSQAEKYCKFLLLPPGVALTERVWKIP